MLELNQLHVRVGLRTLLQNVSLHVNAHEFVVILGENGCGKTSLLRCIAGTAPVAGGDIRIADKTHTDWTPVTLAMRRAVMAQSTTTTFDIPVSSLLRLSRHLYPETIDHVAQRIETIAQALELTPLLPQSLNSLSGGERQRVFLAKALLQLQAPNADPAAPDYRNKLLLLDEPTSAMDFRHQGQVLQYLRQLADAGLAIVCISHDINLVSPYASRLVLLAEQQCIADGHPHEVLTPNNLTRCYGTVPELITRAAQPPIVLPPASSHPQLRAIANE